MKDGFRLPVLISSKSDLGRLIRELDAVDNYLQQIVLRQDGAKVELPKISKALQELNTLNTIDLLNSSLRTELLHNLKEYKTQAKVLHISFAAEPSPAFTQKITTWLREQIDPLVLLQIGLQPDIAAGCTLRTRNKYFDFSLRKELAKHKPELIKLISGRLQRPDQIAAANKEIKARVVS